MILDYLFSITSVNVQEQPFTVQHLCRAFYPDNVPNCRSTTWWKRTVTKMLICKVCKVFPSSFFLEYLYTAAPEHLLYTYATATLKEHIVNINWLETITQSYFGYHWKAYFVYSKMVKRSLMTSWGKMFMLDWS